MIDRPTALRDYSNAKACCASFSSAKVYLLQFGEEKTFQIDQKDQAFDFGNDGVSFFKLFKLPGDKSPATCKIVSHASGDGQALNVFFPKVSLLDEQFVVLREMKNDSSRGADPTGSKMGGVDISVPINADDHARYIVIHTTKDYIANGRDIQLTPRGPYLGAGAVPYALSTVMSDNGTIHFLGSPISLTNNMDIFCRPSK